MKKVISLLIILTIIGCDLFAPEESKTSGDDDSTSEFNTIAHDYWGEIRAIEPSSNSKISDETWYEDSSFYHLWVNAFRDASTGDLSGDGIGDMVGIKEAIEEGYFEDLGINAIWLSPFFEGHAPDPSGNMHLYDTKDHYAVQSQFGNLDDVKAVLSAAHSRSIRVIFDFVPNHVSSKHPWFIGSANRDGIHDDWFNWRSSRPTLGWTGLDDVSDWHKNSVRNEYYYGIFWDGMPDLNYNNPDVKKAMADVLVYWLNFGFDGIRVDAIKYIYEDDSTQSDHEDNLEFFQEMRDILDLYNSSGYSKTMIAENWTADIDNLNYYGGTVTKPAFHMTLDFNGAYNTENLINGSLLPVDLLNSSSNYSLIKLGAFLSNHDNVVDRPASLYSGSIPKQKLAAICNTFTNRIPFLYYGNEIGMLGASGNDISLRQDLSWSDVDNQSGNNESLLEWYRAIGVIRNKYNHLFKETPSILDVATDDDIFSYVLSDGTEALLIVINKSEGIGNFTINLDDYTSISGNWSILLGTDSLTEIPPLTARVFYKGNDSITHLFNDTAVAEAEYNITFKSELVNVDTAVSIVLEKYDGSDWSSVGEFLMTSAGSRLLSYVYSFGADKPSGIRYYYIFNNVKHGFYWNEVWSDDYIYWSFNNTNILEDNTYLENEGYQAYDKTYIRGTFDGISGWNSGNGIEMNHVDSYSWSVEKFLTVGDYEFKFAVSDTDWGLTHYPLQSDGNLTYTVAEIGNYKIDFNWSKQSHWTFTLID